MLHMRTSYDDSLLRNLERTIQKGDQVTARTDVRLYIKSESSFEVSIL